MRNKKITKSKYNLSSTEQKACYTIIHTASLSAAGVGAGLAQIPLADNVVITPIQITMIVSLGKVFEQEITKAIAKGLLAGFVASYVGRGVAQAAWGWIPGIGNASNAITAAVITESIGWICVDHFYKERYLIDKGLNVVTDPIYTSKSDEPEQKPSMDADSKDILIAKAMKFINGEKKRIENMEEYKSLLKEFDDALQVYEDDENLESIYSQFLRAI